MSETDWDTVTYLRKKPMNASQARSAKVVAAAQRRGQAVDTSKKFSAATNKQKTASKDTAKLDRETEELHHDRVPPDVGRVIMRVRSEKKFTQKELATKINEKPQVVNDYEAGRAIPNQQILGKLERILGVKLRGKDIGLPLAPKGGQK